MKMQNTQTIKTWHTLPRLYVYNDLSAQAEVILVDDQAHYLAHVMRVRIGDKVRLFNGRQGEWLASVASISKKAVGLTAIEQTRPQSTTPDLWLCCAPIKKNHFDFMIEKATELGVSAIQPVLTDRTQIRDVNIERLQTLAIEAAEQSERLTIPDIKPVMTLKTLISGWSIDRNLIVGAESGEALAPALAFTQAHMKKAAILIGPEGGFTEDEFSHLRQMQNTLMLRLGPRILRADTAAIAALTLWQSALGDWGTKES